MQKNGTIAGIALFCEDIIIGFRTNGLVRLRTSKKYKEEVVDRNVRIYSIYRDPHQNVLWVASDGQGTIMYAKKYSIATNLMLNQLSSNLSRQVRSVMTVSIVVTKWVRSGVMDCCIYRIIVRVRGKFCCYSLLLKESKMLCLIYDGIKNFLFINCSKAVIWMVFDRIWRSGTILLFFEDKALHSVENLPACKPNEITYGYL